jgi:hypothetical protein
MYDNVVVGIVVNKDGKMSPQSALDYWNNAQPSYQGDSAERALFLTA